MNALATSLQTYFTTFAHTQRDLSANTITSYRDTWRMLLKYLTATLGVPADALDFDAVTATNVTGFLDHLEQERGNSTKTRNARLTAIRSVLGRALPDHPEHAATITQVLAIPPKRTTRPVIEFLTPDEVDALLAAPDSTTWTGRRDHALLAMTVQTGLRISEICSLTLDDIHLGAGPHIACTGKGRRQRITPLTRATVTTMTTYLAERSTRPGSALFCGPHGQPLSRDALEHRLAKHLSHRSGHLSQPRRQARHHAHPAAHRGDEPPRRRSRRLRHRALARTRRHPQHRRLPPRRHGHQTSRHRPDQATRRETRDLPARTRHPGLAHIPVTMPTTQPRKPALPAPSPAASA